MVCLVEDAGLYLIEDVFIRDNGVFSRGHGAYLIEGVFGRGHVVI